MCLKKENKTLKESTISGGLQGSLNFETMISFTLLPARIKHPGGDSMARIKQPKWRSQTTVEGSRPV